MLGIGVVACAGLSLTGFLEYLHCIEQVLLCEFVVFRWITFVLEIITETLPIFILKIFYTKSRAQILSRFEN